MRFDESYMRSTKAGALIGDAPKARWHLGLVVQRMSGQFAPTLDVVPRITNKEQVAT